MERKEKEEKLIIEIWENMQPWENVESIPDIPIVNKDIYYKHIIPSIIRCGGIPKCKLSVGATYKGSCRNSDTATWNGEKFTYIRYKFGTTYTEEINHFEDDNGYDLFVPLYML